VARARDLEERAVLLPQRNLAVVTEARHVGSAQVFDGFEDQRVSSRARSIDCRVDHCPEVYGVL